MQNIMMQTIFLSYHNFEHLKQKFKNFKKASKFKLFHYRKELLKLLVSQ